MIDAVIKPGVVAVATIFSATVATVEQIAETGMSSPGTPEILGIYGIGAAIIGLLWKQWRAEATAAQQREAALRDEIQHSKDVEIERLRSEVERLRNESDK